MDRVGEHPSYGIAKARLREGVTVSRIAITADQCEALLHELERRKVLLEAVEAQAAENLSALMDERDKAADAENAASRLRQVVPSLISFAIAAPSNEAAEQARDAVLERARQAMGLDA